jgi:hypothetical protein
MGGLPQLLMGEVDVTVLNAVLYPCTLYAASYGGHGIAKQSAMGSCNQNGVPQPLFVRI